MKKSLIAVAILAACTTSAFAQSSVNLTGTIDVGVEKSSKTRTVVNSSGNSQSQITLSGAEDLGVGLKATFKMSTIVNADDGTTTGFGNNDTYVGLEGSAGKIRLGRSWDPVYSHALTANDRFGVTGYQTLGTALSNNGIRVSNQVLYISPTMHGLTGTLSYGAAEGAKGNGARDGHGFGLRYAAGPLELTAASSRQAGLNMKSVSQIGGAYDFGMARVLLNVQHDNNPGMVGNTDKNAYALGVTAPVGPGLLWASYDIKQFSNISDGRVAQVGYKYSLSKRTTAYGQLGAKNASFTGTSTRGIGAGLTHSF